MMQDAIYRCLVSSYVLLFGETVQCTINQTLKTSHQMSNKPFKKRALALLALQFIQIMNESEGLELNVLSDKAPIYRRRGPNLPHIDYGGSHPFELLEKRRNLLKDTSYSHNSYWYDPNFSADDYTDNKLMYDIDDNYDPNLDPDRSSIPVPEAQQKTNWENFRSIRIKFDSRYLDENSQEKEKDALLKYHVLPTAIQFWTKALKVYPAKRLFISNSCSLSSPSHNAYGFNDADLMIYISADKYCKTPASGDNDAFAIAGADSCDWDQFDRPIGGVVDVCYASFALGDRAKKSLEDTKAMLIDVMIHEIGHILGITSKDLPFYYDRLTGLPRTPRPVKPDSNIDCINGKKSSEMESNIYRPSTSTLKFGAMYPGIKYYEVVTPTVKRVARNHFNCPTMEGLRLENQPNGDDCFGNHWEERLAWDSSMSAKLTPSSIPEVLSPFTLALLEDSGWYKANFSMSKNPSFGHGAGCDFVNKPCIVDDTPTSPQFCNTTDKRIVKCDPTHRMMATCNLYDLSVETGQSYPPIPQVYRYFSNPAWGPLWQRETDWCPMFTQRVFSCSQSFPSAYDEESFTETSRCYNSNGRPMCFETYCSPEQDAVLVRVGERVEMCEYDGQQINASFAGENIYFECPQLKTLCPELICPSGCNGNAVCDWSLEFPKCIYKEKTRDRHQGGDHQTSTGSITVLQLPHVAVVFLVLIGLIVSL